MFEPISSATPDDGWTDGLTGDAVVSVSPLTLWPASLDGWRGRSAATARFSLDRFSDVYLVTDAVSELAAQAASADPNRVRHRGRSPAAGVDHRAASAKVALTVYARVIARPRGPPAGPLSDKLDVESGAAGDALRVVMIDHRR